MIINTLMLDIERSKYQIRFPFDLRGFYISCGFSFLTGIRTSTGFVNQKFTINTSNEQMLHFLSFFFFFFFFTIFLLPRGIRNNVEKRAVHAMMEFSKRMFALFNITNAFKD